jgi:hypothetical protein
MPKIRDPIIAELRRIRDANAKKYNYDIEAMARNYMKLEPWEEKKTVVRRGNRFVTIASLQKAAAKRKADRKRKKS